MAQENMWNRNRGCGDLVLGGCLLPFILIVLLGVLGPTCGVSDKQPAVTTPSSTSPAVLPTRPKKTALGSEGEDNGRD